MKTHEKLNVPALASAMSSEELLNQELEFLWEDRDDSGKSYEIYLGKISRNPIIKSKLSGKCFALPWSNIIKLAVADGVDN